MNQKGFSLVIVLVVWMSAIALLFYILIASTSSIQKNLYTTLFPKPSSFAKTYIKTLEGEDMKLIAGGIDLQKESTSSGQAAIILRSNTGLEGNISGPGKGLSFKAKAIYCEGAPGLQINLGEKIIFDDVITNQSWANYYIEISLPMGENKLTAMLNNSHKSDKCERQVALDYITVSP